MSAKHYFPDSFSCDGHRSSQSGTLHQPLARTPSVAAVVVLAVLMMMMVMILEKEGAVMQEGGVPFFSLFRSHDSYRFAYNSALQNDLLKKNVTLPVKGDRNQGI